MDNFGIHAEPLPRYYPHELPVRNIGYIARKTEWIHNTFQSFNFSFLLRGRGEYRIEKQIWDVVAPCVITQWPGIPVDYGPTETWEELFIIYSPALQPVLERRRFADLARPVWYIREIGPTQRRLTELRELLRDPHTFGRADEIDRVCETMILDSLISESRPTLSASDRIVQAILAFVEKHFTEQIDFDSLAEEHGLSPATFRRYWEKLVSTPPGRYVTHLRMQQACRLLVETEMSVGQIARAVGYPDPLYFSRRFHATIGETATAYRKRNRFHIRLSE